MKTDNRPVKDYQRMAPQDLAKAVGATHADATHLGNLLDKYGGQVAQVRASISRARACWRSPWRM
jgi:hypothetical protein